MPKFVIEKLEPTFHGADKEDYKYDLDHNPDGTSFDVLIVEVQDSKKFILKKHKIKVSIAQK